MWFKKRLMRFSSELAEEAHYLTAETNLVEYSLSCHLLIVSYYVAMNILKMAHIETQEIRDIDDEISSVIGNNLSRMIFLYGPHDKYAPKKYYEELKGK
jgi:hypothetical protein